MHVFEQGPSLQLNPAVQRVGCAMHQEVKEGCASLPQQPTRMLLLCDKLAGL